MGRISLAGSASSFADGLDPVHSRGDALVGAEGVGAEVFGEHGFPGVELEDGVHGGVVGVDEGEGAVVPADLVHEHLEGLECRLVAAVSRR